MKNSVACHKGEMLCNVFGHGEASKYALIIFGIVVLLGVILGVSKKITVYRDFSDATSVITAIVGPILIIAIAGFLNLKQGTQAYTIGKWIGAALETLLIFSTLISTWIDNKSIWKAPLALLTKYSLGILFTLSLIFYLFGGAARKKGESQSDFQLRHQQAKASALGIAAAISGLIFLLVRDKEFRSEKKAEVLPIQNQSNAA